MVASAPGTYAVLAMVGGKSYPSTNMLHVCDVSRLPVTTLPKKFLRVEPAVVQPEQAMLNKGLACSTLTPFGVYRAEGRHVYGLVPEAIFALTNPSDEATLDGNKLCTRGACEVSVRGPGIVQPWT